MMGKGRVLRWAIFWQVLLMSAGLSAAVQARIEDLEARGIRYLRAELLSDGTLSVAVSENAVDDLSVFDGLRVSELAIVMAHADLGLINRLPFVGGAGGGLLNAIPFLGVEDGVLKDVPLLGGKGGLLDSIPLLGSEGGILQSVPVLGDRKMTALDLTPLRGLPLRKLAILACQRVSDLSPLHGMTLEGVSLQRVKDGNLSWLEGMKLKEFSAAWSGVVNIEVLRGMPLEVVDLSGCAGVRDLAPLAGLPLQRLGLAGTMPTNAVCLRGLPLRELDLSSTGLEDISFVAGMPLESLSMDETGVRDLSPLGGMKLRQLSMQGVGVKDLSVLKGMPLVCLRAGRTGVADLTPLRGAPLGRLEVGGTAVTNLDCLAGMPISWLDVRGLDLDSMDGVAALPLEWLFVSADSGSASLEVLRGCRTLKAINGMPVEKFWEMQERLAERRNASALGRVYLRVRDRIRSGLGLRR